MKYVVSLKKDIFKTPEEHQAFIARLEELNLKSIDHSTITSGEFAVVVHHITDLNRLIVLSEIDKIRSAGS